MEIWKPIPSYEGKYEVSNLGRVKSLARHRTICNRWGETRNYLYPEKMLRQADRGNGYLFVGLCSNSNVKYFSIHRLVLIAFQGEKKGMFACHNNGKKHDNCLENLRWDTPQNNTLDMHKHGTMISGEKHCRSNAKLNEADVLEILKDKRSSCQLSKLYGVCDQTILNVRNRKTWRHVNGTR